MCQFPDVSLGDDSVSGGHDWVAAQCARLIQEQDPIKVICGLSPLNILNNGLIVGLVITGLADPLDLRCEIAPNGTDRDVIGAGRAAHRNRKGETGR